MKERVPPSRKPWPILSMLGLWVGDRGQPAATALCVALVRCLSPNQSSKQQLLTITLKAEERVWELPRPSSCGAAVGGTADKTSDVGKQMFGDAGVLGPSMAPWDTAHRQLPGHGQEDLT